MIKVKWLRFSGGLNSKDVVKGLKRLEYSSAGVDGFQIVRFREEYVEGKYIERVEYEEVVKDPFGGELVSNRVIYNQVDFTISLDSRVLELLSPPRSLVKFVTRLGEACDFNVSVEPLFLDLGSFGDRLEFIKFNFFEKSIVVSDLLLAAGVLARVVARGKAGVGDALAQVIGDRPYKVNSISYSSNNPDIRASFSISSDCALRVSGRDSVRVVSELRTFLQSV
ncbi:hypothetical protein DY937_29565 [Pseudomonas aeruginosa]|uniref:hypothetical protein n=1 Tax=Pseudomonas aeruginosa TaxID=287 RepID=UPI000F84A230|nr:hypothetical protein [Pseudomonas aeruginosa]RTS10936.1 hypothetical protein DY937_29565 [Pseudomonas aeruginosa]